MEKQRVIVSWDKDIFDGEIRLLPNVNKVYSQIYNVPEDGASWSLAFEFEETPRIQGYRSKGTVHFISEKAPSEILIHGFTFDFFDGSKKVGSCEVVKFLDGYSISEIETRIELIEEEKNDFRSFINKLITKNAKTNNKDELRKLFKYVDDYSYLFKLILIQDKELAVEYLKNYFFTSPVEDRAVYRSNLSFFTYQFKKVAGADSYQDLLSQVSESVKNHPFIQSELEGID
jgi:hypothetical protein